MTTDIFVENSTSNDFYHYTVSINSIGERVKNTKVGVK